MTEIELEVREHRPNLPHWPEEVWVDMTDDTDGPVTRVTRWTPREEAERDFPVGRRFLLRPIEESDPSN